MRVLVADDERLEREGIVTLLEREFPGECTWIGQATDGRLAARLVAQHRPQVAILDIKMPGLDGLTVARRLRHLVPYAQVILLTAHAEFPYAQQAIRIGVKQYLLKPFAPRELIAAVRDAFACVRGELQRRQPPAEQPRRLLHPAAAAQALFSPAGPDPVLNQVAAALSKEPGSVQVDLLHWGLELLDACRDVLTQVGCTNAELDRAESALTAELAAAASVTQFLQWARRALTDLHDLYQSGRPGTSTHVIRQVVQHLEDHYMERLSLPQLSRHFGISPSHLSRLFKQETGCNFLQYLTRVRLQIARQLLTNTAASVHEVSRLVGFQSHSYFCTVFKRQFGMSPTEYRAASAPVSAKL